MNEHFISCVELTNAITYVWIYLWFHWRMSTLGRTDVVLAALFHSFILCRWVRSSCDCCKYLLWRNILLFFLFLLCINFVSFSILHYALFDAGKSDFFLHSLILSFSISVFFFIPYECLRQLEYGEKLILDSVHFTSQQKREIKQSFVLYAV